MKIYLPSLVLAVSIAWYLNCQAQTPPTASRTSLRSQLEKLVAQKTSASIELNGFWEGQNGSYLAIDKETRMAVITPSPLIFEMRAVKGGVVEQIIPLVDAREWGHFGDLKNGLLGENMGDAGTIYRKLPTSSLELLDLFEAPLSPQTVIDAGIALKNLPSLRSDSLEGVWYDKFSNTVISVEANGKAARLSLPYVYKLRRGPNGDLMVALWLNEGEEKWEKFGVFSEGIIVQHSSGAQYRFVKKTGR